MRLCAGGPHDPRGPKKSAVWLVSFKPRGQDPARPSKIRVLPLCNDCAEDIASVTVKKVRIK